MRPPASRFRAWSSVPGLIPAIQLEPLSPHRMASEMSIRVTTDARGHYRLGGLPVGQPVELRTKLAERMPYRPSSQEFSNAPGIDPPGSTSRLSDGVFRCRERSRTERPASPSRPSSNTFPRSRIRT